MRDEGNLWKRGGVLSVIRLMNKQNVLDIFIFGWIKREESFFTIKKKF